MAPINLDQLLDSAHEQTGLDDLGDPSYREPLARLVDGLNSEAELNGFGANLASTIILRSLRNRLKIEDWWKHHPELSNEVIDRPIIVVGMSRSGTTALSHLLSRDRSLRSLLAWEARDSVPPPETATYWTDPRYLAAIAADASAPLAKTNAMHYDPPDAPLECNGLFNLEFLSTGYSTLFWLPSCMGWMFTADAKGVYRYHQRVLQLLQSRAPGRWNLKAPQHALALEDLRAQYPNATLVVTHRDPAVCAASTASLMSTINDMSSDVSRRKEIGELIAEFFEHKTRNIVNFVKKHGDDSLVHIPYEQLITDPIGAMRHVFAAAGHEPLPVAEAAMKAHVEERPQHSQGVHRYDPADFGLNMGELRERYADYIDTFGVRTA